MPRPQGQWAKQIPKQAPRSGQERLHQVTPPPCIALRQHLFHGPWILTKRCRPAPVERMGQQDVRMHPAEAEFGQWQ